ncbi:MAG: FMN-binding protein [Planctomycetes bacterium]|nr:FMN-binding protein [Planctomycetota bacterium]
MSEAVHATPPSAAARPAPPREPSTLRLIATLGLAGFFSGLAIVGVHALTLPRIEQNRRERLERAILTVLPGSRSFAVFVERDGRLAPLDAEQAKQAGEPPIYAGFDAAGKLVGFALPGSEPGYQDAIHGIFGVDPARRLVVGFQVLESRETPGLGDRILAEEWIAPNFRALAIDPGIEAVAAGKKTAAHQVETITGATISSRAVVRMLQKALERWRAGIEAYAAGAERARRGE